MIVKDTGHVLRIAPVSNTSLAVVWLTRDHGRLATLVKGALRPKSRLVGQIDLFYTCELLFYDRVRRSFQILRECSVLQSRARFRDDWRACAAASCVASLASGLLPDRSPSPSMYDRVEGLLDRFDDDGADASTLLRAELAILDELGLTPRLDRCIACRRDLDVRRPGLRFSAARGGLLCPACDERGPDSSRPIRADVLAVLRAWRRAPDPRAADRIRCTERQIREVEELLGEFLRYHLDRDLPARDIALRILRLPSSGLPTEASVL
jgi:DNA repair protein RecO (recombination protein O)